MNVKYLTLLDLGGVVFQSTGQSNSKIDWAIISALNDKYGYALNIGEDRFPDFLVEYNERSSQLLKGEEFLKEIFDTLEINTELIELAGRHGDVVIVSDNYRENIEYISKRYEFAKWAIREIYSFNYEMIKENPLFFERLKKEIADLEYDRLIFIDDSPEKLASAAKRGVEGLLFRGNEEVRKFYAHD